MRSGLKVIFMGVCGSGKTTLAAHTAETLGCGPVLEADTFHAAETKAKMAAGIPLTDEDRWPWLERIRQTLAASGDRTVVATCSALKKVYREKLQAGELAGRVHFIFLDAPQEVIAARLAARQHEYMPPSLLGSQFNTLERPESGEPVSRISVEGTQEETLSLIIDALERV
jgi:carbohydrate kinase (thermoresistant glucokinase family)